MKKSEPKLVVGKMAKTEQQESPIRRNKARRATCSTSLWCTKDGDCHSAGRTALHDLREENLGILLARQRSNTWKHVPERFRIPTTAIYGRALNFSLSNPRGDSRSVGLKRWRRSKSRHFGCVSVPLPPFFHVRYVKETQKRGGIVKTTRLHPPKAYHFLN